MRILKAFNIQTERTAQSKLTRFKLSFMGKKKKILQRKYKEGSFRIALLYIPHKQSTHMSSL